MSKGPWPFRQRDLTRAIKAARAAGMEPTSARIDPNGGIVLGFTAEAAPPEDAWDRVLGLCHSAHRPQVIRPGGGT